MPEPHPSHPHIPRHTPRHEIRSADPDEQLLAIEEHLSTIEGMQYADHAALTTLIDTIGASPDAATGAEGKGMRRQVAELSRAVTDQGKKLDDIQQKVNSLTEGRATVGGMPPRGSIAGNVGAVIGGIMATCVVVLEILKVVGVVK